MSFTLSEKLFLLAFDDEKGVVVGSLANTLAYGLAGAVMADLLLAKRICIHDDHCVLVEDSSELEDPVLKRALKMIVETKKNHKITYWVRSLSETPKRLRKRLVEEMVEKGIFTDDEDNLSVANPALPDLPSKFDLKARLRSCILSGGELEVEDLALLSLIRASGLMSLVFTRDERKLADRRIYEKLVGAAMSNPEAQGINEIERAVGVVLAEAE